MGIWVLCVSAPTLSPPSRPSSYPLCPQWCENPAVFLPRVIMRSLGGDHLKEPLGAPWVVCRGQGAALTTPSVSGASGRQVSCRKR